MSSIRTQRALWNLQDEQQRRENAFALPFALKQSHIDVLNRLYDPLRFRGGTRSPTDHPIMAAHLAYATHRCYEEAAPSVAHGVLEIGPNLSAHAKIANGRAGKVHACTLFTPRDQARHARSAQSLGSGSTDPDYARSVYRVARGETTDRICLGGAENCGFQADHAIAIHSLYDIPLRVLGRIFAVHNIRTMTAFLHFPTQMLQPIQHFANADEGWEARFVGSGVQAPAYLPDAAKKISAAQIRDDSRVRRGKGSRLRFSFIGDASFAYEHDFDTWFSYLLCSGVETPAGFGIMIEKTRHHGTHFELRLTRVTGLGTLTHVVPTGLDAVVFVPDLIHAARRNFYRGHTQQHHITVDQCPPGMRWIPTQRVKAHQLMDYLLSRDDKGFTLAAARAYARSLKRSIVIGEEVVENAWDVDMDDYMAIVVSLYILALVQRKTGDATVKAAVDSIGNQSLTEYITDPLLHAYRFIFPGGRDDLLFPDCKAFVARLKTWSAQPTVIKQTVECPAVDLRRPKELRVVQQEDPKLAVIPVAVGPPPGFAGFGPDFARGHRTLFTPSEPEPASTDEAVEAPVHTCLTRVEAINAALDEYHATHDVERPIREMQFLRACWNYYVPNRAERRHQFVVDSVLPCIARLFEVPQPPPAPLAMVEDHFADKPVEPTNLIPGMRMPPSKLADLWTAYVRDANALRSAWNSPRDAHPRLRDALRTAAALMPEIPLPKLRETCGKLEFVVGVPGSGKTASTVRRLRGLTSTLVVCPTADLAGEWRTMMPNVTVCTTHTGIICAGGQYDYVVIDEVFTQPLSVVIALASVARLKTYCLGDPMQIGYINFDQSPKLDNLAMVADWIKYFPRHVLRKTHRVPADVAALPLIKAAYPGITSQSRVKKSIEYKPRTHICNIPDGFVALCYTQAVKNLVRLANPDITVRTIHESQGQTFQKVVLVFDGTEDEKRLWLNSPAHTIVGMTRHTRKLVIASDLAVADVRINRQLFGELLLNNLPEIDAALEMAGAPLIADDLAVIEHPVVASMVSEKFEKPSLSHVDATMAATAMEQMFPSAMRDKPHLTVDNAWFKRPQCERLKISLATMRDKTMAALKRTGTDRTLPGPCYGRVSVSGVESAAVSGAIERLCKKTVNMPPDEARALARKMYRRLSEYVNFKALGQDKRALHTATTEMLVKFTQRGHDADRLDDPIHDPLIKCSLHAKAQFKADLTPEAFTRDKCPQTITAWGKGVNATVAPWARVLEIALITQARDGFLFASRMCEEMLLATLTDRVAPHHRFLANDFSEFDSTQNNVTRELVALALKDVGCPPEVVARYMSYCEERYVTSMSASTRVHDKRDSGEPFTLVGNTIFCAAVTLSCVKGQIDGACFKGDDSLIFGPEPEWDEDFMKQMREWCGYRMKPEFGTICEFVGYIVSGAGCVPDLPRMYAKFSGKRFPNPEKFSEFAVSVRDRLKCTGNNPYVEAHWATLNAAYRKKCPEKMTILLEFLKRVAAGEVTYTDLVKESPIIRMVGCPADLLP